LFGEATACAAGLSHDDVKAIVHRVAEPPPQRPKANGFELFAGLTWPSTEKDVDAVLGHYLWRPLQNAPVVECNAAASTGVAAAVGRIRLRDLANELAATLPGGRNRSLYNAAFKSALSGCIIREEGKPAFREAMTANGWLQEESEAAFAASFNSGWRDGDERRRLEAVAAMAVPPPPPPSPPPSPINEPDDAASAAALSETLNEPERASAAAEPEKPGFMPKDGLEEPAPEPPETHKPPHKRPVIRLQVGETEAVVDAVEEALVAAECDLYQRGGLIVVPSFAKMPTHDGKTVEVQGLDEIGDHALAAKIETIVTFEKVVGKAKKVRCAAPMALIKTLKERRHELKVPVIAAVVNCPTIRADGAVVDRPGFDTATGLLFEPRGVVFPPVPDKPTEEDARRALAKIEALFEESAFASEDDKAVALSLTLTAVARASLPCAPLHAIDAPVAGEGKSLIIDIGAIVATGEQAGVSSQGESREEFEKRLGSLLLRGDAFIALDNCERPLEGVLLNQCLTQTVVNVRVLGKSLSVAIRMASVMTATGNNLVIKGDLTRRAVAARLDSKTERPELRQFKADPIGAVKKHRGAYVAAALTVLRAYVVAGRPNLPDKLAGFGDWSDMVRGPLLWLGRGDPVKTMERIRKSDPQKRELRAVMAAWRQAFVDAPTTVHEALKKADDKTGDIYLNPELRDALTLTAGRDDRISAKSLGRWLSWRADQVANLGQAAKPDFAAFENAGDIHGRAQWRVVDRNPKRKEEQS
jgi:hypothetical protein